VIEVSIVAIHHAIREHKDDKFDVVPGGNLSDLEYAIFTRGGRCMPEPNNAIFNFENGYIVPPSSHQGFPFWDKRIYLYSVFAQEDVN
ncbi:hypothetical protein NQZ68_026619, partial [Dissostichus eleginoides]